MKALMSASVLQKESVKPCSQVVSPLEDPRNRLAFKREGARRKTVSALNITSSQGLEEVGTGLTFLHHRPDHPESVS
jgi:hypothetical protein